MNQMTKHLGRVAGVAVLAMGALALSPTPASAEHVATRCDWRGCARIACNYTGNRCYRIPAYRYDDEYGDAYRYDRSYEGDRFYTRPESESDRGWHYDCDRDADRCYVRRHDPYGE